VFAYSNKNTTTSVVVFLLGTVGDFNAWAKLIRPAQNACDAAHAAGRQKVASIVFAYSKKKATTRVVVSFLGSGGNR
jgi:hypothetical protein